MPFSRAEEALRPGVPSNPVLSPGFPGLCWPGEVTSSGGQFGRHGGARRTVTFPRYAFSLIVWLTNEIKALRGWGVSSIYIKLHSLCVLFVKYFAGCDWSIGKDLARFLAKG